MRIKICGLTVPEEARACAEAGAWAVGVVFAAGSSRRVDAGTAAEVLAALPDGVARVGVFVDPAIDELRAVTGRCGLTHVQLHGRWPADAPAIRAATGARVIAGVPFDGPGAVARAAATGADLVLYDAAVPGLHGGTGRTLDWAALVAAAPERPYGLAGGLDPGNVGEAVRVVRPDLVDVSSGVESSPGRKDPARVREFCAAARAAAGTGSPTTTRGGA